eukprot:CAMPEP_0174230778 /NCGR_PEP_ID=MMETSP0417-20130205/1466_1 /TAXON_ID=242541 /ORGANISM="Mayorella sp, Strain BSH-02190019" /LENGTH=300 /DNA_ID=CAMNT_0015308537 /DNA_START=105 /DNA_END=1004 /DNA_ORIENTATION=-
MAPKPANTAFKQQRLRACQPILTPIPVICTFVVLTVVCIPLGAVLLDASNNVQQYTTDYTDCADVGEPCLVNIDVKKDMKGPVYLYYRMSNFYQNHRRYVNSKSDDQLSGDPITKVSSLGSCDPLITYTGNDDDNAILNPCGLIANSTFSDDFLNMTNSNGTEIVWTQDKVAWQSDLDKKFANPPEGSVPNQSINYTNPTFVVWMRVAGLPTFRKLHRIIHQDLPADTYTIRLIYDYDVDEWGGSKKVILSTVSWAGGQNSFLGILYIVIGSISFCIAIVFFLKHKLRPRKLGDLKLIDW